MTRDEWMVQLIEDTYFTARCRWMDDGNPYIFDGCTLKTRIGEYTSGTEIASISIDVEKQEMQLFPSKISKPERFRLAVKLEVFDV